LAPRFWLEAAAAEPGTPGETILVVLQLSGGNDGLNTVVPVTDPDYRRARPSLAIDAGRALSVAEGIGFHPAMRGMADLLEENMLSVVQGVGYPNPNRSHFESMDIWHTCKRKTDRRVDGWLGRYLDASQEQHGSDVPALHLGRDKQPFALATRQVRVPSVRSLDEFRLSFANQEELVRSIDELSQLNRPKSDDLLGFVHTSTATALSASRRVADVSQEKEPPVTYPTSALSKDLQTVAQLIDAGLSTRVYYVALDGFDTHARQADAHSSLLRTWSDAVTTFVRDLNQRGHADRVLVVAFSEFGRRVQENASRGTDHGTAAPMFLAGKSVKSGLIGDHPSLTDLDQGDLKFHTDFRSVYASVLEKWLGWPSESIVGAKFPLIDAIG
jgi:uncharacterized protein (DUF1501 family)